MIFKRFITANVLVMLSLFQPTMEHATVESEGYTYQKPALPRLEVLAQPSNTLATKSKVRWDYSNPNKDWGVHFPLCSGHMQSPIPLFSVHARVLRNRPLHFGNYENRLSGLLTLINNGHTINMEIPVTENGKRPFISGGMLKSRYEAMALHFHWGSPGFPGSEHPINGFYYDAEMHIVHKNVHYKTMAEARLKSDGMAVFGIMMTMVDKPRFLNTGLSMVFNRAPRLKNFNSTSTLSGMSLKHFIGNLNTKTFYTYKGSLTTPTCGESATWHVFPEPLHIPSTEGHKLFEIIDWNNRPLINNKRPLQDYNKRIVYLIKP